MTGAPSCHLLNSTYATLIVLLEIISASGLLLGAALILKYFKTSAEL
jgi:hypothetical protein